MYGDERLNPHHVLRYALTKEFVETFSFLKSSGIELPLTLVRDYHMHIRSFVDQNLSNWNLIRQLQKRHGLYTIGDVQRVLERRPPVIEDLSQDSARDILVAQVQYIPFTLDRFPRSKVLTIAYSTRDEQMADRHLSEFYRVFRVRREIENAQPDRLKVAALLKKLDPVLFRLQHHPVFSTTEFRLWFRRLLISSVKLVHVLDRMILDYPVRVILCNVEAVNPGTTLSLLAALYNLDFINAPTHVITNRNLIPTRATYHCAWGEYYRDWLEKRGIDPARIICTGNLRFEYEFHPASLDRNTLASQLDYPAENFVVLFTSQPFSREVNEELARWIEQAVIGNPVTVLIKPHPSDTTNYAPFTRTGSIMVVPEWAKLPDLLPNIDFLMTISSSTAIEGALRGKGLIVLQPALPYHYETNNNDINAFLVRSRAGFVASSPQQLARIISRLCHSERWRKRLHMMTQAFLEKTIHKGVYSNPSGDIYQLIKNLLG
ncbi:hypothetical protein Daud_0026 [Candidatus Desulforudis audaxviator MP104C]|uniref:Capsule polysaccharide biosynthesis protein n=1 Tax=Desulforudis audaxviator (strain MP104C) TaxID=477974 RepID=B1I175_DESAP|nr:hypothetical protein [Candidatus Desulforudis audaxviator]ACA58595.1 hypothetical protein Daud_0026 [Candidatus Desulforudis audaxviator MP104C]AZK58589.1 spore coat polysaccharide synthesis protein [Candidatus Desulforudis audaxviator]